MPKAPAVINARAANGSLEIDMFGGIGGWDGIMASRIKEILDSNAGATEIVVNINSPGGDVFEGVAIYNLLATHEANVTTRVYGLAASAASVVAIAGDNVLMGDGSFMMIHNAWTVAIGDSREMAKMGRTLGAIDKELAASYASHTGIDTTEIKSMMDAETWISAADAVDQGFADGTFEAPAEAKNSFDLSAFKNVPRALAKKRSKSAGKSSEQPASSPAKVDYAPVLAAIERLNSALK